MNEILQEFARNELKSGLSVLKDRHRNIFKRMYSPNNLDLDINTVVDNMTYEKLSHAMTQVQRSIEGLQNE